MNTLLVDHEACKQDGLCVAECPMQILELDDAKHPRFVPEGADFCIQCGHCVAVCPHGALGLTAMPAYECPPLKKELNISAAQAEQFLRSRRSIRQYKDEAVGQETLAELLRLASYAPSGHNWQPLSWLVISGRDKVHELAGYVAEWMRWMLKEQSETALAMHMDVVIQRWEEGKDRILRNAPHVVIAHAPEVDRSALSAGITALAYLELAAPSLGLGTCWAGFFNAAAQFFPPLQEKLALPQGHKAVAAAMVGYPNVKYYRLPLRKSPIIAWR
ncbi:MAG: nitroreductase family protein [Deltaproteobacteria bacterium]|nr:nitroreductase family protein [Deltaproteobacteria bacterium]